MLEATITRSKLLVTACSALTSNSVEQHVMKFTFSDEWIDLVKTAVFSNDGVLMSCSIDNNSCVIPWEVLKNSGTLNIGVTGTDGGSRRFTTTISKINIYDSLISTVTGEQATLEWWEKYYMQVTEQVALAKQAVSQYPKVIDGLLYFWNGTEFVKTTVTDGLNAYELAVQNGYVGSVEEWLESLKGKNGENYVLTDADKVEIANTASYSHTMLKRPIFLDCPNYQDECDFENITLIGENRVEVKKSTHAIEYVDDNNEVQSANITMTFYNNVPLKTTRIVTYNPKYIHNNFGAGFIIKTKTDDNKDVGSLYSPFVADNMIANNADKNYQPNYGFKPFGNEGVYLSKSYLDFGGNADDSNLAIVTLIPVKSGTTYFIEPFEISIEDGMGGIV